MTSGTGTCTVKVNRAGDATYEDAAEVSDTADATKISQAALTLSGVPASAAVNSNFTVTPGGGSSSASLVVSTAGVCSASGNQITMTSGTGTCTVKVNRAGDNDYNAATEVSHDATATKLSQAALTIGGVPATAAFNSSFTVTPGGGSSSAPFVVSTTGPCSASGNDITMTSGTGTCTVKVNRAGDATYEDAAEVSDTADATKISQAALTLSGVPSSAAVNSNFTVTPGGGSSSASLVVSTAGVCSASGNQITMTSGSGTCTVKVNRAGDSNYDAATEVSHDATATKLSQAALTIGGVPATAAFNSSFTVTPGGGSSSAPFVVSTTGPCSASGNDITMTSGTGTCTVKVNRAGDATYEDAAEVSDTADATKISQAALTLSGVPSSAAVNSNFTVTPGGGSSSASLVVSTAGVCSASGNQITMTSGSGTCTVKVNRAGDSNYDAAAEVSHDATATKLSQAALTIGGVPATAAFNSSFTVTPGGGSSSAPFVVSTTGPCSASGNDITMTSGTGTCTVKVNRAGDATYEDAAEVSDTADATKISQAALTLSGVPSSAAVNSNFTVTPGGGSSSASLVVSTAGVCSASGNQITMTSGTGTCTVKVNRAGDNDYNAATEVSHDATATKLSQAALTIGGVPATAAFNSSFTVTPGGGSSSAPFVVSTTGPCSASGNDITMTSGTGTCTVKVNRAGDATYEDAAEVSDTADATKISQAALTLSGVPSSAAVNSNFTVTPGGGSSSASLVVSTAGVCSASGNQITMTSGSGTCTVKVNRAGDSNYDAAAEVSHDATATKLSQAALTIGGVPATAAFNSSFTVTPGGGSSSAPFVVSTTGPCSASGNDITMTSGTGTCTVKVNRAGDATYEDAAEVSDTADATKISQAALTLSGVPSSAAVNSNFTVTPGGGSSSASLVVSTAGVCSASGNQITMTSGSGTCTVKVNRAGDSNYDAAAEVSHDATATKLSQAALTIGGVPATAAFNSSFTVTPGGGSSSAPFVVSTTGPCSASGNDITMTSGTGTCTVKVNRAGDATYEDAAEVSDTADATKISQAALTLSGVPASAAFNSNFTVTPGGGSSSASLVVSTAGVCSASGNQITMTSGTGTCTVKVNRAGDSNYNAATEVSHDATATKLNQAALTLTGVPATAAYNSTFTVTPGGGSSSAPLVVSTSGVCTAAGNDITMTSGTGTCTVKVNRAGDNAYSTRPKCRMSRRQQDQSDDTLERDATKISQAALTLTGVPASAAFNSSFTVTPGGGSSSASLVVSTAGVCSAAGNDITMTSGTGTCTVKVNRAGDSNYNAATEVSHDRRRPPRSIRQR